MEDNGTLSIDPSLLNDVESAGFDPREVAEAALRRVVEETVDPRDEDGWWKLSKDERDRRWNAIAPETRRRLDELSRQQDARAVAFWGEWVRKNGHPAEGMMAWTIEDE